jgi:hypothetical protein
MKPLTKAIQDYLAMRRDLGFKLRDAGMLLAKFAACAPGDRQGVEGESPKR